MGGFKAREKFLSNLSTDLGIDEQRLKEAFKNASEQTVNQALQDGYLTQAQAERARGRIEQGRAWGPFGRPWSMVARMHQQVQEVFDAVSQRLGMSATDLENRLSHGEHLTDILREKNVSEDELRHIVVNAVKPRLDEAVRDGKITSKFEDAILRRIQEEPILSKVA